MLYGLHSSSAGHIHTHMQSGQESKTPRYTSVNRQRTTPQTLTETTHDNDKNNNDWHSSISFDTENIMNGLKFQTNSQAEQIHIRVTATTENMHSHSNQPLPSNRHHPQTDKVENGLINGVRSGADEGSTSVSAVTTTTSNAEEEEVEYTASGNGGGGVSETPKHTMTTITNPIKLIITTTGALGHHNQHRYQEMKIGYADVDVGNYDVDEGDGYDLHTGMGMDLASLLAHHEANLDNDIGISNSQGEDELAEENEEEEGNGTVKSATTEAMVPQEPSLPPQEQQPSLVKEITSEIVGGGDVNGGGVGGGEYGYGEEEAVMEMPGGEVVDGTVEVSQSYRH